MNLRPLVATDLDALWPIFHAITKEGLMLAHDETTTREAFELLDGPRRGAVDCRAR